MFLQIPPDHLAEGKIKRPGILNVFHECLPAAVDVPVEPIELQILVCREVVAKDVRCISVLEDHRIGTVGVHFEEHMFIVGKIESKTSFIAELPGAGDPLSDDLREKIDAVPAGALKRSGERKTAELRRQVCPDVKRARADLETQDKFILALAETLGDNSASKLCVQPLR